MVDFSVEGLISAKDKASDAIDRVGDAARNAAVQAREAAGGIDSLENAMSQASGVASVFDRSMDNAEESIDDFNSETQQALGQLNALQAQMVSTSTTASLFEERMDDIQFRELMQTSTFSEELSKEFNDVLDPRTRGRIMGSVSNQDGTLGDFARRLNEETDLARGDIARGITRAATSFEGDLPDTIDDAEGSMQDVMNSFEEMAEAGDRMPNVVPTDADEEDMGTFQQEVFRMGAQFPKQTKALERFAKSDLSLDDPSDVAELQNMIFPEAMLDNEDFKRQLQSDLDLTGPQLGQLKQTDLSEMTVQDAAQDLTTERDFAPDDFNRNLRGIFNSMQAGSVSLGMVERQADDAEDETGQLSRALQRLQAVAGVSIPTLTVLAERLDEVGDESDKTTSQVNDLLGAITEIGPELSTVSANIGPFNVGLRNVLVTLPALLAIVGPLVAVLGGLASAILGVAGAFIALLAVGAIDFAEQLEERFASITNTTEAFSAMAKGLARALDEAVAPLRNVTLGDTGMGAIDFFIRIVQDLVLFVRVLADAFAQVLEMEEVAAFFFALEDAFLGTGEAGEGTIGTVDAFTKMLEQILPFITDFVYWFSKVLPQAFLFFGNVTEDFLPILAEFGISLLNLTTSLTKLGVGVLDVVLPALSMLLNTVSVLTEVVLALTNALGPAWEALSILAITVGFTTLVMLKLVGAFAGILGYVDDFIALMSGASRVVVASVVAVSLLAGAIVLTIDAIRRFLEITGALGPLLDILSTLFEQTVVPILDLVGALFAVSEQDGVIGFLANLIVIVLELLVAKKMLLAFMSTELAVGFANTAVSAALTALRFATLQRVTLALRGAIIGLQAATILAAGSVAALAAAVALGIVDLEDLGAIGKNIHHVLEQIADATMFTTRSLEAMLGTIVAVTTALHALKTAGLIAGASNPLILGLVAIGGAIALIITHWDQFTSMLGQAAEILGSEIMPLVTQLARLVRSIGMQDAADLFLSGIRSLLDTLVGAVDYVGSLLQQVANILSGRFIGQGLSGLAGGVVDVGTSAVGMGAGAVGDTAMGAASSLTVNVDAGNGNMDARKAHRIGETVKNHQRIERRRQGGF